MIGRAQAGDHTRPHNRYHRHGTDAAGAEGVPADTKYGRAYTWQQEGGSSNAILIECSCHRLHINKATGRNGLHGLPAYLLVAVGPQVYRELSV